MAHASPGRSPRHTSTAFHAQLTTQQPEVAAWLSLHLRGTAHQVAVELTARYFETAERWGDTLPILEQSRLNLELSQQVPTIHPEQRWMTELPIAVESGDRLAIGRLLRAIVTVSQACA